LSLRTNISTDTGSIEPPAAYTPVLIPGLSQTVNVSGNPKILIHFGVDAYTGYCYGCPIKTAEIAVVVDGVTANLVVQSMEGPENNITGSWLMAVGPGPHTVQIKGSYDGTNGVSAIGFGGGGGAKSYLIVQVIPE